MNNDVDLWSRIDHRLAELKIRDASPRLNMSLSVTLIGLVVKSGESGGNNVSASKITSLFKMVNLKIGIAYQKYKEVWKIQGNQESPEFVRTLHEHLIIPLIEHQLGKIRDRLNKIPADAAPITKEIRSLLVVAEYEGHKCKLKWERKCEIEALELEHAINSRTPRSDNDSESQTVAASIESLSKRPGKKPDESVRRRREIVIKKILSQASFRNDEILKDLFSALDAASIPLPERRRAPGGWHPDNWIGLLEKPKSTETKRMLDLLRRDRFPKKSNDAKRTM